MNKELESGWFESQIERYRSVYPSNSNAFMEGMNDEEGKAIWLGLKSGLKHGVFDNDEDAGFIKHTAIRMWRELNTVFG